MNAERLLQFYDRVCEAPDAISRLRQFVLDLAVRGKLVEQASDDGLSLEDLKAARERLENAASTTKRLRWKPSTPVSTDQTSKQVPKGWLLARVNDTGLYINGLAFKPTDWKQEGLPIIRIQNLTDPTKPFNFAQGDFPDEVLVRDGDLLVSWSATLDAFKWERGLGVLNQHIFRVIPDKELTSPPFLLLLLRNAIREMAESEHAHGLAMMHINRGPFLNHIVLIPPLPEQHRIVAKVDELMALCDSLEAERERREATRDRLTTASLSRLTAPEVDEKQFKAHADFAIKVLPELTTRPDQIKVLRQTILDLAVRGKLVEQDPSDEPAERQLERFSIVKSKDRRGRDWSRSHKQVSQRGFQPPSGWAWTTIDHVVERVTVGHVGSMKDRYVDRGIPFLRSMNVRPNSFRELGLTYITRKFHEQLKKSELRPGDVVVVRSGNVGTACVIPPQLEEANCSDLVVIQRPVCVLPEFLCFYLNSHAMVHVQSGSVGVALTHFNTRSVATMPLPLPPLREQQRIVTKVTDLLRLLDEFEERLAADERSRNHLIGALVNDRSMLEHRTFA